MTTADSAEAHYALGNAYQEQGRLDDAAACYQKALSLNPDFAEAHFNLAKVFDAQGRSEDAFAGFQEAVLLNPELAEGHFALGVKVQAQGLIDDALDCFRTALSLKPELVEARWALAMSQLAVVHANADDPEKVRAAFSEALAELDRWFDARRVKDGFKAVGIMQPFYLAYHEQNNRALLSQYGDLCARLMRHWQEAQALRITPGARGDRLRIGIVSAQIYDQPVWNGLIKGWCRHLDRDRLSLHIFHLGTWQDQQTASARSQAAYFAQGPKPLRSWTDAILGQSLDVIIYPDVGMDAVTTKLASLRLAPVQIAAWGHPETTGLPTIDYYLSAESFEPSDAQANYRERLIALPHLGCCYPALDVSPADIDPGELGIAPGAPLLLCPGTPFKYAPQHDWVFVEIARRLGRCQLVFFNHWLENLSEKLQQRLHAVFAQADMYLDEYAVFVPWLNRPAFFALLKRADVYLDTIGFSGFNTAMQAVECAVPIVTREGEFMRGRFASGILQRMGLHELVMHNDEDYVAAVVRLAQDSGYRRSISERMVSARSILFDDVVPIRALERFLIEVVDVQRHS